MRREVKQQVSKHSSPENERQETKPRATVTLPVLSPKYSSIQPTSDPAAPRIEISGSYVRTVSSYLCIFKRAHDYVYSGKL